MQVEIPVNQKSSAIHFLHSCHYGDEEAGAEVARYVIHFEDGSQELVPVIMGQDMVDNWLHVCRPEKLEGVKNLVWQKKFSLDDGIGTLGLTQQTWNNQKHAEKIITHIDFVSTGARAAPYLLAVTLD